MINRRVAALLVLIAPLAACVSGSSGTGDPNPNAGFQARFVPLGGVMPFPNDLYFNGSTTGTLNIPGSATVTQNTPLLALNHLDGYGTQSDINIYFTAPVDKTTLTPANVIVLKVSSDPATKAVTGFVSPLVPGTDYSIALSAGIDSAGEVVTIKPLHPLAPSTVNASTHVATPSTYLVIVTDGVKDSSGATVTPSADYSAVLAADIPALTKTGADPTKIAMAANDPLFPVAEFSLGQIAVAAGAGVDPTKIAVTFSFSTAYLGVTLGVISQTATAGSGTVAATGLTTHDLEAALPGIADVYAGVVTIPYYLSVPSASNPTAALTGIWHTASGGDTTVLTPMPKAPTNQTIPVLMSVPNAGSGCPTPGAGWPVVIFQHGITQNRTNLIAVADALAQACFAAVAIDLPLHGITNTSTDVATNPFYQNQLFKTAAPALMTGERTFNMDLENNTTLAAGPDGTVDGSGAWFINLTSTITSRDNLREAAADLIALTRTIQGSKLLGVPLDASKIGFVGHSLGGIVGTPYLAVDPSAFAAILANPGGHIAELLRNSAEFGPIIDGELAANGLLKGSQAYYDFYSEAQAAVEDGDPANYAALASQGHPIHMIEVVGDGTAANPSDLVVPNSATDVLIAQMGITTPLHTAGLNPVAAGVGSSTLAQFTVGDHGSLLDPSAPTTTQAAAYLAVTTEMQKEMASIFATSGAAVAVTDTTNLSTTLKQ